MGAGSFLPLACVKRWRVGKAQKNKIKISQLPPQILCHPMSD
jgi:hypothetical protein